MLLILGYTGVMFPGVWMRSRAERVMPEAFSALEEVKLRKAGVAASQDVPAQAIVLWLRLPAPAPHPSAYG
jgi:hypothetical protein